MCDKTPYQPAPPTTCCHVRRDGRGCAIFDDNDCTGTDNTKGCFMRCIVFTRPAKDTYFAVSREEWERMQREAKPVSEFFDRHRAKKRQSTDIEFAEDCLQ